MTSVMHKRMCSRATEQESINTTVNQHRKDHKEVLKHKWKTKQLCDCHTEKESSQQQNE